MNDVKQIIERMKKAFGVRTNKELANKLETSLSNIDNWKKRNSIPDKYILLTSQMTMVNKDWLLTGEGEMHTTSKESPDNYIEAEVLTIRPGAGPSGANLEAIDLFDTGEKILIDRTLFKSPPKGKLRAMQVDGYSMVPMLFPDSWVIVDETKEFAGDGLYVINVDNVLMVKLIEKNLSTGNLYIKSINPDYDSWEIKEDDQRHFAIFGKVIRCII